MAILPSQLEDIVADVEDLARFLTSSGQYNAQMPKPSAFLPNSKDRETSVFRHGLEPREMLWEIGAIVEKEGRTLHGAAIVSAGVVRAEKLEVVAAEPPPRHAAITGWPWHESDPDLQKSQQKEIANRLASQSKLIRR